MTIRVLPEARADLREAIRHYRAIEPLALGKQLAARVLDAFKKAVQSVGEMPAFPARAPRYSGCSLGALS